MKKSFSNTLNIVLVGIIIIMAGSTTASGASYSDAGSSTDPLVTLSYVEERIESLNSSLDARLKALESNSGSGGEAVSYKVVKVNEGQIISLEANAQFVLRTGMATAIAGQGGGLSDLTTGINLSTGDSVALNHLLLIPQSDGRGVEMNSNGYVMISGGYSIK